MVATTMQAGTCPKCGGSAVQGQLVPRKQFGAGILTALFTDDAAAGGLVANNGKLIVQAFCLACGAIWLPFEEYLIRAVQGALGAEAQRKALDELEALVERGSGFKLVSGEAGQLARWAESVLAAA